MDYNNNWIFMLHFRRFLDVISFLRQLFAYILTRFHWKHNVLWKHYDRISLRPFTHRPQLNFIHRKRTGLVNSIVALKWNVTLFKSTETMPMFNKLRRASHCPIQSKKDASKSVEPRSDAEIIERLNSLVIQHFGGTVHKFKFFFSSHVIRSYVWMLHWFI